MCLHISLGLVMTKLYRYLVIQLPLTLLIIVCSCQFSLGMMPLVT